MRRDLEEYRCSFTAVGCDSAELEESIYRSAGCLSLPHQESGLDEHFSELNFGDKDVLSGKGFHIEGHTEPGTFHTSAMDTQKPSSFVDPSMPPQLDESCTDPNCFTIELSGNRDAAKELLTLKLALNNSGATTIVLNDAKWQIVAEFFLQHELVRIMIVLHRAGPADVPYTTLVSLLSGSAFTFHMCCETIQRAYRSGENESRSLLTPSELYPGASHLNTEQVREYLELLRIPVKQIHPFQHQQALQSLATSCSWPVNRRLLSENRAVAHVQSFMLECENIDQIRLSIAILHELCDDPVSKQASIESIRSKPGTLEFLQKQIGDHTSNATKDMARSVLYACDAKMDVAAQEQTHKIESGNIVSN